MGVGGISVWQILIVVGFSLPAAVCAGLVARKIGRRVWVWVVVSLIPGIGPLFLGYLVVASIIDRLESISARLG